MSDESKCPKCHCPKADDLTCKVSAILGSRVTDKGGEAICTETDGAECLRRQLAAAQAERDTAQAGGAGLIAAERDRQRTAEAFDAKHDAAHQWGELRDAAICYVQAANAHSPQEFRWPWDSGCWKPKDRIRNLVRAGALIAAEIDRLEAAALAAQEQPHAE